MSTDQTFLTMMYGNDDEDIDTTNTVPLDSEFGISAAGKFVTLTIDGNKVDVPSNFYVHSLENLVVNQTRQLSRLQNQVRMMRTTINKLIDDMRDVNRELDRKMNLRDLP